MFRFRKMSQEALENAFKGMSRDASTRYFRLKRDLDLYKERERLDQERAGDRGEVWKIRREAHRSEDNAHNTRRREARDARFYAYTLNNSHNTALYADDKKAYRDRLLPYEVSNALHANQWADRTKLIKDENDQIAKASKTAWEDLRKNLSDAAHARVNKYAGLRESYDKEWQGYDEDRARDRDAYWKARPTAYSDDLAFIAGDYASSWNGRAQRLAREHDVSLVFSKKGVANTWEYVRLTLGKQLLRGWRSTQYYVGAPLMHLLEGLQTVGRKLYRALQWVAMRVRESYAALISYPSRIRSVLALHVHEFNASVVRQVLRGKGWTTLLYADSMNRLKQAPVRAFNRIPIETKRLLRNAKNEIAYGAAASVVVVDWSQIAARAIYRSMTWLALKANELIRDAGIAIYRGVQDNAGLAPYYRHKQAKLLAPEKPSAPSNLVADIGNIVTSVSQSASAFFHGTSVAARSRRLALSQTNLIPSTGNRP